MALLCSHAGSWVTGTAPQPAARLLMTDTCHSAGQGWHPAVGRRPRHTARQHPAKGTHRAVSRRHARTHTHTHARKLHGPLQHSNMRTHPQKITPDKGAALLNASHACVVRVSPCACQGCYDVGLPSNKSLFQLHAERLLAVQRLAAAAAAGAGGQPAQVPWYIMTSPFTHQDTL